MNFDVESRPSDAKTRLTLPVGCVIAAPASGAGKTLIALGLIGALARRGLRVSAAKVGPDYIDPAFHAAACGRAGVNLDSWAMRPALLQYLAADAAQEADILIVEGVMGLFDGAADGRGSTADVASRFGLPVVLVVDAARQGQSVAALVRGFRDHRPELRLAGVILNRVASDRHAGLLRTALADISMPVFGAVARTGSLTVPERHLGLVPATEHPDLAARLAVAADAITTGVDLNALLAAIAGNGATGADDGKIATPACVGVRTPDFGAALFSGPPPLPPLGQHIAIARDAAFAFIYPHLLSGWRRAGAEMSFFSPLADEPPRPEADAVFLPGGYPELHAERISNAKRFATGLHHLVAEGAAVYGECGGFMALGRGLVDAAGRRHAMLGLLPIETTFANRRLHLGYRRLRAAAPPPVAAWAHIPAFAAHEFHYAHLIAAISSPPTRGNSAAAQPLFAAWDAQAGALGLHGAVAGRVFGSFMHVVDVVDPPAPH